MAYKLNIRGASDWVNLLQDTYIGVADTNSNFTATSLDGVLDELFNGLGGGGGGGLTWAITSTAVSATTDKGYFVDTSAGQVTITLPASPSIGDTVAVVDYDGSFATNKCIIGRNTKNIMGLAEDFDCDFNNLGIVFVYSDATQGWKISYTSDGNAGGGGGISWVVISGATNAVAGIGYMVDSGTAVTVTLPSGPSTGHEVAVTDMTGEAETNNITIARNGKNILGAAEDLLINIDRGSVTLTYSDTTNGWVLTKSVSIQP
jgi:hypothetical protein